MLGINKWKTGWRELALAGVILFSLGGLASPRQVAAQGGRKHVSIPDIPGYLTLKADFHMHTVFSDGQVLPTTRVAEAWREGLDIIAITDHDTSDPDHIVGDKNTPFELAKTAAARNGLILVNASEITRFQPPDRVGHFNALFLDDVTPVVGKDYYEAIKAAVAQGAFIFLNHPSESWNSHLWKEEFQRLEADGLIHGVEVVNGGRYYDNAQTWCNEKGLVPIGTSDLHGPSHYTFGYDPAGHRPMTLVFATDRSPDGVRAALFAGRTAVYADHSLYGKSDFLEPLFDASVRVLTPEVSISGTGTASVEVRNLSDVDFILAPPSGVDGGWIPVEGDRDLEAAGAVTLPAQRVARISVRNEREEGKAGTFQVRLRYVASNLVVAPDAATEVSIPVTVRVEPEGG
jgi:predicted metal-dependent phosphoesterase TrpH